jgi:hypothetical protein
LRPFATPGSPLRIDRSRVPGQSSRIAEPGTGRLSRAALPRTASGHPVNNLAVMAYNTAEARQELLDTLAAATDQIGVALELLGEAYERVDEHTADQLEQQLFRPVQAAYGRAQRTHTEFAARHELPSRRFEPGAAAPPSLGVRGLLEGAVDAVGRADAGLAGLQDSMLPVEVGDSELRAGLGEVRRLIEDLRGRTRELVRTLGR